MYKQETQGQVSAYEKHISVICSQMLVSAGILHFSLK